MKQTEILSKCLSQWNCSIEYLCNWDAIGNGQQIKEYREGNVCVTLHNRGSIYFICENVNKSMYPHVWRVTYNEPAIVELTEADFNEWLNSHK